MSDWVGEARRKHRRRKRLEGADACVICGENDLRALVPVHVHLVEQDHVFGEQRDPIAILALCRNHHAILTEERRDAGVPMRVGPNPLEEAAMMDRSLGLALNWIGNALLDRSDWELDLNDHLLSEHPEIQETLEDFPSTYETRGDDDD